MMSCSNRGRDQIKKVDTPEKSSRLGIDVVIRAGVDGASVLVSGGRFSRSIV